MKRLTLKNIFLLVFALLPFAAFAQGLKAFQLKNGLTVLIWEDNTKSDVHGIVACRTGSVNDPAEYTGLAHYLEHVMFKGTSLIGALDWEKEKPLYEQIIAKYDEMAETADPARKKALNDEINTLTVEAGKISVPTEFMNLIEGMGGKGLNAATGYDMTFYYNSFPPYQINKWLEIYSQRFINPVFRTFQTELESVYEEYNMMQLDNPSAMQNQFIFSKAYEGHPYARPVIGQPEHLKNPRLSKLIEFYEQWYTPENMALILVGNVDARKVSGRINATFGRLPRKPTLQRATYPDLGIQGRKQYSGKAGYYPTVCLVYNGVKAGHPDEKALDIALALLHNSSNTGTLDRLVTEGELTMGVAMSDSRLDQGRNLVMAVPLYDENQRRFDSNRSTERKVLRAVEQVAKGEFEQWQIDAVKANMCRDYDLMMESNERKAQVLMNAFIYGVDLGEVLNYKDAIMGITIDDVKRVAGQYLGENFIALHLEKGKADKGARIPKPGYKPVEPPVGKESLYATQFKHLPIGQVEERFIDFGAVQTRQLNDRSKMHYTVNPENNVFSLTLRYGVGDREYPKLGIAAQLMNDAGVMGSYEPQQLKEELSKLNATCRVSATDDYLYVTMEGYEETLVDACQLLARQMLMPRLDEKQLARLKGTYLGTRQQRKDNANMLAAALQHYILYGEKSPFIDELTDMEIYGLQISELTGDITRAANYEAEIFYCGNLPFEQVYDVLSHNLPLVANERPTASPQDRPLTQVSENTVYFLPNSDAEQAQIFFFLPMQAYDIADDVMRDAFNQYFSGGFNGLVLDEIRNKRSMAYSAYADVLTPSVPGNPTFMLGSLSTQNDKANEAIDVFMGLVNDMPRNPSRIDNIKSYLRQEALTTHPSFRDLAETVNSLQRVGYTDDPAHVNLPKIDALTFDDIVKFYQDNIQGKPYAIGIMGNPKLIDQNRLEKYGKVVKLNERKLFNAKDALF